MKNIQLIAILVIVFLLPISGNAADKDVYVINTPLDEEVVNTEPMPTVVYNTSSNPIPVTMNLSRGPRAISAYAVIDNSNNPPQTIYTVPANKRFILTDIFTTTYAVFEIFENDSLKAKVDLGDETPALSMHLRTGIPFSSGSTVKIYQGFGSGKNITITGYLLNN